MVKVSYITATEWAETRIGFLQQAEESLAAQTLSSIEWIIISANPAKDCLHGLVNTTCIHLPNVPWGQTHLQNRGIEAAQGDYLAFMDDDNRKKPGFGEEMTRFLEVGCLDAAYCFAQRIDSNNKYESSHHIDTVDYHAAWNNSEFYHNDELLIKRKVMESIGGFDMEVRFGEDYELAFRLMRDVKIGLNPVELAELRSHPDQYTAKHDNVSMAQFTLHRILEKHGRLNPNCPICGVSLEGKPQKEVHMAWMKVKSEMRLWRFCTHPGFHP